MADEFDELVNAHFDPHEQRRVKLYDYAIESEGLVATIALPFSIAEAQSLFDIIEKPMADESLKTVAEVYEAMDEPDRLYLVTWAWTTAVSLINTFTASVPWDFQQRKFVGEVVETEADESDG